MAHKKDTQGKTPSEERAEIGTPAGESPSEGRKRHRTQLMRHEVDIDSETTRRVTIEDEPEDEMAMEEFSEGGDEISTAGGITGTHVHGGVPAGGATQGGTPGEPEEMRSGDYKKTR